MVPVYSFRNLKNLKKKDISPVRELIDWLRLNELEVSLADGNIWLNCNNELLEGKDYQGRIEFNAVPGTNKSGRERVIQFLIEAAPYKTEGEIYKPNHPIRPERVMFRAENLNSNNPWEPRFQQGLSENFKLTPERYLGVLRRTPLVVNFPPVK